MFIRFDVIHERDRRTDGQKTDGRTLHDSIDRACIASRGKNKCTETIQIPPLVKAQNSPCNVAYGSGMTCRGIRPNVRRIGILHLVSILTISP